MLKVIFSILALYSFASVAADKPLNSPDPFQTPEGKAVFVDFLEADYNIEYDMKAKTSKVVATIKFRMPEKGLPIFDSLTTPTSIVMDGKKVKQKLTVTPDKATKLRVVQSKLEPGVHTMKIEVPMDEKYLMPTLKFGEDKVHNFFHLSDGEDKGYLELYLPANLEYDQVKMNFDVKFKNSKIKHKVFANGNVKKVSDTNYKISFPEYFTTSSLFFQVDAENFVKEMKFELKSIDGRKIPAVVYYTEDDKDASEEMLKKIVEMTTETFAELESDFGAFPHDMFLVYDEGGGMNDEPGSGMGMEYCGATVIYGLSPLRHEIIHSYFGRGVMPANGNAGWIDEALTTWAEEGYDKKYALTPDDARGLATMPQYVRHHHDGGYTSGAEFIKYLHGRTENKGGLKPFLKDWVAKRKHQVITTEDFVKDLNEYYGESFDDDFQKYIYAPEKYELDDDK